MSTLTLENIFVSYGSRSALHGISMRVDHGEIVALIGSNGAGKTTTLRAIMGLVAPSKGTITLDDQAINGLAPPEIVSRGIALSPEGRRVFPYMTVEDNLIMGGYLQKDRQIVKADMARIYSYFPRLKERRKQLAGSLSGGEQQMLAIGRALMARPKLLLLDEPSLGLAPIRIQEIGKIIVDISREEKLSVVLVEQNANLALRLCQRAYVLESGKIGLQGTGKELAKSDHIRKAYLGI